MIQNELAILRKIRHPNIVQLLEDYETSSELYLIMELIKVGIVMGLSNCTLTCLML